MSFRSQIPFLVAIFLAAVGGTFLAIQFFGNQPSQTQTQLVTVVVVWTNTPDPDAGPTLVVVTATPDRTLFPIPDGLDVPTGDGSAQTFNPDIASTLIVQTPGGTGEAASGVPQGCILHVVDSGDSVFGIAEEYGVSPFLMLQVNGLTEDDILQIGDELVVPVDTCPVDQISPPATAAPFASDTPEATEEATEDESERTPTPSISPTITLAPTAENAVLEIVGIVGAGDVTAEGIRIRNPGSNSTVTVTGWTLEDVDGNVYEFRRDQRIFSNSEVTIFTRAGQDTPIALFWGLDEAVWQQNDVVTLRDSEGDVRAVFRVVADIDL